MQHYPVKMLHLVFERAMHFEDVFNAVSATQVVFQQPARTGSLPDTGETVFFIDGKLEMLDVIFQS